MSISTDAMASRGAVVITGASTGIGEACARRLDRIGFTVFAGVRNDADGDRLRSGATARLTPVRLDVTDELTIAAAKRQVVAAVGDRGIAGVVNNAGVVMGGPIEFLQIDEWRTQFEINVFGALAVTRAFIPLVRHGHGRVVFIGSIGGRVSAPFTAPYSASKFALEAIADSLRIELGPWQIDVAIVEPGNIATPIFKKIEDETNRLERELPEEAMELYGSRIAAAKGYIEDATRRAIPPDRVAKKVQHALTAKRPKTRYLVGMDAHIAAAASTVLPDRILDRVILMQLGLGKESKAGPKKAAS